MKINKIFFPAALYVAITSGAMIRSAYHDYNAYEKAKVELRSTPGLSQDEYKELIKPQKAISAKSVEAYRLKNIADSLKMKAAVERAYQEGAQMVRDSLKTAAIK